MPRKLSSLTIEENSGNHFSNLAGAQRDALPLMADHLQSIMSELLKSGALVKVNGRIVPGTK